MEVKPSPLSQDFSGLTRLEASLPSRWYYEPAQYALELERIWYRNWIYLCRADSIPEPGSFRTFTLGTQPLLVLRGEQGELRGFFNTCRHRGAMLCNEPAGRLAGRGITCLYHAWHYRLNGELARIPNTGRSHHVPMEKTSLYPLSLRVWRGFVYVNLADPAKGDAAPFDANVDTVANWPLEDLVVGHRLSKRVRCNWKIFWENYNECLHCPNVHPLLSSLVPIYRRGIMEERDDPEWRNHADENDPALRGGLRKGAATWSRDGQSLGVQFPGLSEQERRVGYHFVTNLPSHYLVAHVDYVRSSRLLPLGPDETEIEVEWLFPRATLDDASANIRSACEFSAQVLAEDAAVCELNQRGLRAAPHTQGMLMPEEYDLFRLHEWIRRQLRS